MFWADKFLEDIDSPQVINDAWTPSGIAHMGSLKGPVIHDVLYRILKQKGVDVKFLYGFDDFDVIDGLPDDLKKDYEKYMGVPISNVPWHEGGTFGEHFAGRMKTILDKLGIKPQIYKTSELYREGKFDDSIKFLLNNADRVRKVYSDMYKKPVPSNWYPLQVICPHCGKLGTTKVTNWDGKMVKYECLEDLVKWAKGCGAKGEISPFGGNGKMPFKVEWAAKWALFGVTIEGSGKDHGSAGGSYDVARELIKNVFHKKQPFGLVYEFFLLGGRKMSSSKGLGLTGEELLEILPPQIARFLMIRTNPSQAVEFDPRNKDIIPRLYDDYQKGGGRYMRKEESDLARPFELSQVGEIDIPPTVRFATLVQWVQMPNMKKTIKDRSGDEWIQYVKTWVEKYAPADEKFEVHDKMPAKAKQLSIKQKEFLKNVMPLLDEIEDPEALQLALYNVAKELDLPSKEAFAAVYISILGKDHGPKAAWLILSLDKEFVKKRFKEVSK